MKKLKILYGAGLTGKMALKYFGDENVYCFLDNIKHGQQFYGKETISYEQFIKEKDNFELVITISDTKFKLIKEIKQQLKSIGVTAKTFFEIVEAEAESLPQNKEMLKFKDLHKGESCFVIGNGPSLNSKDLDRIKEMNLVSFGSNRIGEIFDKTNWRPNYYMVQDPIFVNNYSDVIRDIKVEHKFIPDPHDAILNGSDALAEKLKASYGKLYYYYGIRLPLDNIKFSEDLSKMFTLGGTVTGGLIQLAIYMGFKKIYLIGVDGTNSIVTDKDYLSENRHFYNESAETLKNTKVVYHISNLTDNKILEREVLIKLNEFALSKDIHILNATRGGVLEVFERADFEDIV